MVENKAQESSFSRNFSNVSALETPGIKYGPNGTFYVSSGISDLDRIIGGGFPLGSLVMVMEDAEAPHHMLLLRNFMSQGLVHHQPLLYASPSKDPRGFLGTLPSPSTSAKDKPINEDQEQNSLRIAWQYKKYFGEDHQIIDVNRVNKQEFCSEFDIRKPLERHLFSGQYVDCVSTKDTPSLSAFQDHCATFLAQFSRSDSKLSRCGRIAIQSLCAPQCEYINKDWDMLSFIQSLKSKLCSANAVAVITFPPSLLSPSICKRWQHMADILLSVKAIPDEDKELAKLLTGYQDMIGFLNIHKIARINTQARVILEATTYSIKLHKRRFLALECLNQAPVDGSSGSSYSTTSSCSTSSRNGTLDF
ncbi:hypothetical protein K2173_019357 [Erythroxylum novogranatense]|uniref:Elongator complex protein 4 n=1 Tax=Erythroxylum novogranatense TaxID=1862640 RepID=A0AAV8UB97_9ROSI|nr:hypothetical protein K2173_019357 [Erythroxylum novogranatense]